MSLGDKPQREGREGPQIRYPDELRHLLVAKFDEYKKQMVEEVKMAPSTMKLFPFYIGQVRKVLADMRKHQLPREIQEEIRLIAANTFEMIREMAHDSGIAVAVPFDKVKKSNGGTEKPEEQHAKVIIESTKALAKVIVPEEEIKILEFVETTTDNILAAAPLIPNQKLRDELENTLRDIKFPTRKKSDTEENYQTRIKETGYKGGVARLILKIYVYLLALELLPRPTWLTHTFSKEDVARIEMLLGAEVPLTDKDIVTGFAGDEMWEVSQELGVDPDGVEKMQPFGVVRYMNSRDIDMNQVLLTKLTLFFTVQAFTSVVTGVINSAGRARTIFGVDTFRYMKQRFHTNKILHRLVKNVVEGKAVSFQLPTYNRYVMIGIYWLVLIRRMVGKTDQNLKIAKIWSCALQMGQTKAKTPQAFIKELVAVYPEFSFRKNQTIEDIARWILGKFTVSAFRHLKVKFGVNPDWAYESTDPTPFVVTPQVDGMKPVQFEAIERIIIELHDRESERQHPATI